MTTYLMKIFLIGPGGVGKSTSGPILADMLDYEFVDLDSEFCKRIQKIGNYIRDYGYEKYCLKNSELFYKLLDEDKEDAVFSLSSGFLVHKNLDELVLKHQKTIKDTGISILLLPSNSLEESKKIIVERQLSRGFGLKRNREAEKVNRRFYIYKKFGDIKIFSHDSPKIIANLMKEKLKGNFKKPDIHDSSW